MQHILHGGRGGSSPGLRHKSSNTLVCTPPRVRLAHSRRTLPPPPRHLARHLVNRRLNVARTLLPFDEFLFVAFRPDTSSLRSLGLQLVVVETVPKLHKRGL